HVASPIMCSCPLLCLLSFFYASGAHLELHSFPTRRSSDLVRVLFRDARVVEYRAPGGRDRGDGDHDGVGDQPDARDRLAQGDGRSEEHTSELQSPDHLVCRLLLEKKKDDDLANSCLTMCMT